MWFSLSDCGFSGVWQSQTIPTGVDLFNNNMLQRLRDQFTQQWNSDIDNSPKSSNFRMFKQNFEREHYLISLYHQHSLSRSLNLDVEIINSLLKNSEKHQKTEM